MAWNEWSNFDTAGPMGGALGNWNRQSNLQDMARTLEQ